MMSFPWQQKQRDYFNKIYKRDRIPHALLISGVSGLGQRQFADWIVRSIHCETNSDAHAICGQCHSCQLLLAGNHPDHSLISPEEIGKQLKIEQIRDLKNKQTLTSHVSQSKTVIIEPADAMTISAYNSLLKLLEEPPEHTTLLLITDKPDRLPITILSRCQTIPLTTPNTDDAIQWLGEQGSSGDEVYSLLELCNGAPLAVQTLIDEDYDEVLSSIKADFRKLLQYKANPIDLTNKWKEYNLSLVFNYLQTLIKQSLIKFNLNNNIKAQQRYLLIYDCIISTIKLLSSSHNLNKVLLIEQFMVSVMDAEQTKKLLV